MLESHAYYAGNSSTVANHRGCPCATRLGSILEKNNREDWLLGFEVWLLEIRRKTIENRIDQISVIQNVFKS